MESRNQCTQCQPPDLIQPNIVEIQPSASSNPAFNLLGNSFSKNTSNPSQSIIKRKWDRLLRPSSYSTLCQFSNRLNLGKKKTVPFYTFWRMKLHKYHKKKAPYLGRIYSLRFKKINILTWENERKSWHQSSYVIISRAQGHKTILGLSTQPSYNATSSRQQTSTSAQ